MLADEQNQLIRRYVAAYNAFDVEGMVRLLSSEVRFENWSGGELTAEASGISAFKRLASQAATLFSQREQRITSVTWCVESVVVSIAYCGQLAVDIPNGPRAGAVLNLNGESRSAFKDGLISNIIDRS